MEILRVLRLPALKAPQGNFSDFHLCRRDPRDKIFQISPAPKTTKRKFFRFLPAPKASERKLGFFPTPKTPKRNFRDFYLPRRRSREKLDFSPHRRHPRIFFQIFTYADGTPEFWFRFYLRRRRSREKHFNFHKFLPAPKTPERKF